MKIVQVVGAVIKNNENEILCALRSGTMSMPNLWEFPGGKIENGESPETALIREIKEELNCTIKVLQLIKDITYDYPNVTVRFKTYHAEIINGIPTAKEHTKLEWRKIEDLRSLTWAPADIPTIKALL